MRLVASLLLLATLSAIIVKTPVFGFGAITFFLAIISTYALDYKKIIVERPYFIGAKVAGLIGLGTIFSAAIRTVSRAVALSFLALFTFPGQSDLTDRLAPAIIFLSVVIVGVVIALFFDTITEKRGHRWALYRLAIVLGIIFSISVFAVQQSTITTNGQRIEYGLFAPPKTEEVIVSLNQIVSKTRKINKEKRRAEECSEERIQKLPEWRRGIHRVINACDKPVGLSLSFFSEEAVPEIIKFITLIDGYLDSIIASILSNLAGVLLPALERPAYQLASIFISSNVVQGFVIALYASIFSGLLRSRKLSD